MSFSLCLSFCHSYLHAYEMHNCVCKAPEFPKQIGGTGTLYILPEGVCACMRAIAYPQYRKQLKTHFLSSF